MDENEGDDPILSGVDLVGVFLVIIVGLVLEYALIKLASAFTFEEVKA